MLVLLSSAAAVLATCSGSPEGCFLDAAPAPGVPPVRAVGHLVSGPSANMTVAECAGACSAHGYAYAEYEGLGSRTPIAWALSPGEMSLRQEMQVSRAAVV